VLELAAKFESPEVYEAVMVYVPVAGNGPVQVAEVMEVVVLTFAVAHKVPDCGPP
jgi:hypothetical protein